MKKLVLTGAAGRLGSYLREPLTALCDELVSTDIADDIEVRVHDSTADLRYLVLPMRPAGTDDWDTEALQSLVTRDTMIGVSIPDAANLSPDT